jgi:hypothetical protein
MQENQQDKVESTNKGGAPVGNKNAAKGAQLTAMLMAALDVNNKEKLREGVQKVAQAFAEGERWAVEFVFDRAEGKAVARQEITGADGADLPLSIGVTFVKPNSSES